MGHSPEQISKIIHRFGFEGGEAKIAKDMLKSGMNYSEMLLRMHAQFGSTPATQELFRDATSNLRTKITLYEQLEELGVLPPKEFTEKRKEAEINLKKLISLFPNINKPED